MPINTATQEAESEGFHIQGQPGPHSETIFKKFLNKLLATLVFKTLRNET